jgi:hypothetical protein
LSSNTASVAFTSIPQTYTDLLFRIAAKSTGNRTATGVTLAFNGSTSNFITIRLYGTGTTNGVYSAGNFAVAAVGTQTAADNLFSNGDIYISNYTSSNIKPFSTDNVTENAAADAIQDLVAGVWNQTPAVTSVTFTTDTGGEVFVANSTFYLYGIKNS